VNADPVDPFDGDPSTGNVFDRGQGLRRSLQTGARDILM